MGCRNISGRFVARYRYERRWTQDILVARMQCLGFDISRQKLAKIELGTRKISDDLLVGFQKVFGIPLIRFFPQEVQDLDAKFASRFESNPSQKLIRRRSHGKD